MALLKVIVTLLLVAVISSELASALGIDTAPNQIVPRTGFNPLAPETVTLQQSERRLRELLNLMYEKIRQLESAQMAGLPIGGMPFMAAMSTMGGLGGAGSAMGAVPSWMG